MKGKCKRKWGIPLMSDKKTKYKNKVNLKLIRV